MSSFHSKKGFVKYSRGPHPIFILIVIAVLLGIYYGPNELKKADTKVKDFFTRMDKSVEPSPTPSVSLMVSKAEPLRASPTPTKKPTNGNGVAPQSGAEGTSSTNESYQYPTWIFPTVAPGQPGSKEWNEQFWKQWNDMTKQNQQMQQQVQQSQQQFCQQNPTLCGH
ncbi:MAG: hypothetical protein Q7S61_06330 [bacterium]|nr:hypothetical protein [bacterium]